MSYNISVFTVQSMQIISNHFHFNYIHMMIGIDNVTVRVSDESSIHKYVMS